jgi:hypothetical protein
VIIGPRWDIWNVQCQWHGERECVQGRWLSGLWASRIQWDRRVIKDSQSERRRLALLQKKWRINERFATCGDLPF